MEVALAAPRTAEQYAQALREGLELTSRMRDLVEAIREIVDGQKLESQAADEVELGAALGEVVDGLQPVAQAKGVRLLLAQTGDSLTPRVGRQRLATLTFQCLESAVSLASPGSEIRIDAESSPARVRFCWHGEKCVALSHPELALLVAQAGWEGVGAEWRRERVKNVETVTIALPSALDAHGES